VEAIASRQEEIGGSGWQHPLSRDCQTIRDHVTRWGFAEPHRVFLCAGASCFAGHASCRARCEPRIVPPALAAALFFRPKTRRY